MKNLKDIQIDKTLILLEELPEFCTLFYSAKQLKISPATQLNYARRMKVFLSYLMEQTTDYLNVSIRDFTLDDLADISNDMANNFYDYIIKSGCSHATAIAYCESISTYYNYFSSHYFKLSTGDTFACNPFRSMNLTKPGKQHSLFLDEDSQGVILSEVRQEIDNDKKTAIQLRDCVIFQLLFDTGIRVSELVSLDIDDLLLRKNCLYVSRNNKDVKLSFSSYTAKTITEYLSLRDEFYHPDESQRALFLSSTRGKNINKESDTAITSTYDRLTERSIQRIVKKYAVRAGIPNANRITPKVLRDSYAIQMMSLTNYNFELIRDIMGTRDISRTLEYAISINK